VAFTAKAQYNYSTLGVGIGFSSVKGYTNLRKNNNDKAYDFNFIYNYSPYVPIAAEIQFGKLSGGGLTIDQDLHRRQYSNNYKALIIHADLQAGEVIEYENSPFMNFIKGFYIGTGIGLISNNLKVQRTSLDNPNYVFPGKDDGINLALPLRFGYELKIYDDYDQPFMGIIVGYNHSVIFGGDLDGYSDPSGKFKNNALSQYRQINVGLRFNFGNTVSYNRSIRGR